MTINKTKFAKIVIYLVAWVVITILLASMFESSSSIFWYSGAIVGWAFAGLFSAAILISLAIVFLFIGGVWEWLND